jgi:two-component system sensor histidine kinase VanS
MKRSIRSKLFTSIGLIMLLFIGLLWILNNMYLGKYYIQQKKNSLIANAKQINKLYKGNVSDTQLQLDKIANMISSNLEIKDSNGNTVYRSARRMGQGENGRGPNINMRHNDLNSGINPPPISNDSSNYQVNVYKIDTQRDTQLQIDFLTLITGLNNGYSLSIRTPVLSINESVATANNFILFSGMVILIIGSLWAYIFSRRFTQPILELNSITRKISKLDFTEKCSVKGRDEIGQLGDSINHLSEELGKAMTELNIKNAKLEEDIDKERKIDEMRKEFISSVSHELRTPISIIQGYSEGLISNVVESDEDRIFYCDVIMKEADKMNKLVKDLLDISQIESGYFVLEKTEFELTELIKYVGNRYGIIMREKNISLDMNMPGEVLVYADMMRIEQVLTNYLTNAVNHVDDKKLIKIDIETIGDKVTVNIFNSGNSIPEESLDKIWGSFYKVDKARTRAYGGYGLGLSIVKAIMDMHDNTYGVKNLQGGVAFWFQIDLSKN